MNPRSNSTRSAETHFSSDSKWKENPICILSTLKNMNMVLPGVLCQMPEGHGFNSQWCHRHNTSSRTMALWLAQPLREVSTRNNAWGVKAAGAKVDNLTTFMCWMSCNLGASTLRNPQGLSRPAVGLLYLQLFTRCEKSVAWVVRVKFLLHHLSNSVKFFMINLH
jgi:hypothetical protein